MEKQLERKHYITALKGLACLLIALGHFIGTIKYSTGNVTNTQWLDFFKTYKLDFLINESFYLYLFFVVSGYLVAQSKILCIKDFFVKSITRFFRLAIPIFFACIIIFIISKILPFYNVNVALLFENDWLKTFYNTNFSILDALLSPISVLIFKNSMFNSPYWVLSNMLLASILIYLISYLRTKINKEQIKFLAIIVIMLLLFFIDKIIFTCVIGSALFYYESKISSFFKSKKLLLICGLATFIICFFNNIIGAILFFSWVVIASPRFSRLRSVLENRVLIFIGNISFGIYSFHWPVFCSIGCILIIALLENVSMGMAMLIAILLSMIIIIILSIIFNQIAEKPSDKIVAWIRHWLSKLLSNTKN